MAVASPDKAVIELGGVTMTIVATGSGEVRAGVAARELDAGVFEITLSASGTEGLSEVCVSSDFSATDKHALFHPFTSLASPVLPFWERRFHTSASEGMPFWAFLHQGGDNRLAIGFEDTCAPAETDYTLSEHTRRLALSTRRRVAGAGEHTERVFLSVAAEGLARTIARFSDFASRALPPPAPVPAAAYDPVFCSWTAVQHRVDGAWVERATALASSLGLRTFLLDGGWEEFQVDPRDDSAISQLGGGVTFASLGTWQPSPSRFPDFAAHVARVKALGMRYLLWIAPFVVGPLSPHHARFAKLGWVFDPVPFAPFRDVLHLDPRFEEVRQYVRDTLLGLAHDFGLDGFKLDFIDGIGGRPLGTGVEEPATDGGRALVELLAATAAALRERTPDLLMESRMGYANVAARAWSTSFRSSDVPLNPHQNRLQCTMLRLLAPDRATWFDPDLWAPDDPVENVARHLISALSAVPMVGIDLESYPAEHLDVIRHWIGFYNEHRATLAHGRFEPLLQLGHNPLTWFHGDAESIATLHADIPLELDPPGGRAVYVANASSRPYVSLAWTAGADVEVATFGPVGAQTGGGRLRAPARVEVPVGGYARVT